MPFLWRWSNNLRVPVEELAQVGGRFDSVFLHDLEQAQDVAHTRQRDPLLPSQVLHHLHLSDVALRISPAIGRSAMRLDEACVLIEHKGARMSLEDLRRDADRVQGLVEVAERWLYPTRARPAAH